MIHEPRSCTAFLASHNGTAVTSDRHIREERQEEIRIDKKCDALHVGHLS